MRNAMSRLPDLGPVSNDAMLVASELVTNAVQHSLCADDEFLTVSISRDGWLRISVRDPGRSGGSAGIADRPLELGGMGLKVVDALAQDWGAEHRDDGYEVWAELALAA
jgi:anti-sigma regulatory factor (Ser/Thr protein kinase)